MFPAVWLLLRLLQHETLKLNLRPYTSPNLPKSVPKTSQSLPFAGPSRAPVFTCSTRRTDPKDPTPIIRTCLAPENVRFPRASFFVIWRGLRS